MVTNIKTRDVHSLSESNKNGLYSIKSKGIIQSFVFVLCPTIKTQCSKDRMSE